MVASGRLGNAAARRGPDGRDRRSPACRRGCVVAFLVYFTLGFALYAAMYAGAGSLLSRAEDLQMIALPLSIPAIMGYLPAVLALSGSTSRVHPVRVVRAAVEPVRDDVAAGDRAGGAVGARALARAAHRHGAAGRRSSRSASTGPACCCTASRRRSACSSARSRGLGAAAARPRPAPRRTAGGGTGRAPGRPAAVGAGLGGLGRRCRRRGARLGSATIDRHSLLRTPGR